MRTAPPPTPNFPDIDLGHKCEHTHEKGQICGQCASQLRAEGFLDGYNEALLGAKKPVEGIEDID